MLVDEMDSMLEGKIKQKIAIVTFVSRKRKNKSAHAIAKSVPKKFEVLGFKRCEDQSFIAKDIQV